MNSVYVTGPRAPAPVSGWTSYTKLLPLTSHHGRGDYLCQQLCKVKTYSVTPCWTQVLLGPTLGTYRKVHGYPAVKLAGLGEY